MKIHSLVAFKTLLSCKSVNTLNDKKLLSLSLSLEAYLFKLQNLASPFPRPHLV